MGTQSKKIQEASDEEARRLQAQGQELAAAQEAELQRQADDLAAAQEARVNAQNAAQQLYQQRMNEGYNAFADIIAGQNRQMQQEQAEAQQQIAADKRAARWTGATELAASIANLIGVGAGNAVSQQYKTYSQDWMQKADRDIREHRARMDNLRDRQRALQLQLNQLKMGDAGTALANARRDADQAVQDRIALGQARANAALAPLQTRQQAEDRAGQQRVQGAQQAAHVGVQESQLGLRYADQQFERDKYATQMHANGWVEDPEAQGGFRYDPKEANEKYGIPIPGDDFKPGDSDIAVTIAAHGDEPEETIYIKPESLVSTIQTNYHKIKLSEEDEARIKYIIHDTSKSADQMADALKPLLVTNPELRGLVRRSASGRKVYDTNSTQGNDVDQRVSSFFNGASSDPRAIQGGSAMSDSRKK